MSMIPIPRMYNVDADTMDVDKREEIPIPRMYNVDAMDVDKREEPCAEDAKTIIIQRKQERVLELRDVIKTNSAEKLQNENLSKSEIMSFANYNNIFIDEKLIKDTYTRENIFDIYNKLCQRYKDEISDVYIRDDE